MDKTTMRFHPSNFEITLSVDAYELQRAMGVRFETVYHNLRKGQVYCHGLMRAPAGMYIGFEELEGLQDG